MRPLALPPVFLPVPSDDPQDDFNVVGDEIFATFSPWASWMSVGNPFGFTPWMSAPALAAAGAADATTSTDPGSVIAVSSGGITINLVFDAAALAAPASFRAGIQQAAAIMSAAISDKITVNLKIDYSGTGGGAAAGPDHGVFQSYSSVRANLINFATPGDPAFSALAAGSSIQGQSNVAVWNAQLKLWGLLGANDTTTDDGSATFATDINPNLLVGVALHEMTHALGRVPYGSQPDIFDLFRFTSPGTRLFQGGASAPAAYFSLDGGASKLADYGRTSDASDFLNSGVQGGSDPFNEFYNGGTTQQLTATDLRQLDALGFHLMSSSDTQAPTLVSDIAFSIQTGATLTITSALLGATDNVSSAAQLHYTVVTGPAHGALLLNGAAASSFTQADIDNGRVSYHETASGVTSDSFSFRIADAAGNTTGTTPFLINISNDVSVDVVNPARTPSDFNHDGSSDVLWRNDSSGHVYWWEVHNGSALSRDSGSSGIDHKVVGIGDFNGDGTSDVLWRNDSSGHVGSWEMHNDAFAWRDLGGSGVDHTVAGIGDFNGDGTSDVVWRNDSSGHVGIWEMHNGVPAWQDLGGSGADHKVVGIGDFNGDGTSDVLWRNDSTGHVGIWEMHNDVPAWLDLGGSGVDHKVVGIGDFNGDGTSDVLWRNDSTGHVGIWEMHNDVPAWRDLGGSGVDYNVVGIGDFNGDHTSDVLWRNSAGHIGWWEMHNDTQSWHDFASSGGVLLA